MNSITLKYEVEPVEGLYPGALANITAKVFLSGKEIGVIAGIEVDRQRIGENSFHVTFDEHSGDLEWVGSTLLEKRYGRTKLQSLRDAGDDNEFNFFFIDTFRIDANQSSDVATFALRTFLHGEHIKGNLNYGCWINSSVSYVLHGVEESSEEGTGKRKRGNENETYHEVIPFLRNGFFQDPAIIRGDSDNARIIVGGVSHFKKRLLSESEAKAKAGLLLHPGSSQKKMKAVDTEILNLVRNVNHNENTSSQFGACVPGLSSVMLGLTQYQPPRDGTSEKQLQRLKQQIQKLQAKGGSVARSGALHAACEMNLIKVAKLLLQIDATSVTAKDHLGRTPLIMAAIHAGGSISINGMDDTEVIDALLNVGAKKSDVDSSNMTAYGHFRIVSSRWLKITHQNRRHTLTNLEHKLYPLGGPTRGDFSEGKGGVSGIVDYGPEDDEADREMGRGAYADGSDY